MTLIQAVLGTSVQLRIAGDGALRNEVEQAAGQADNIHLEGYVIGEKLAALFRNAAFMVIPSEWYENAPMSVLEAYAYGKPVIGARIGGIPELVRPGETGNLFETAHVDSLRNALLQLWGNRAALAELGKNARKLVEDQFSLKLHCKRLMNLYEDVVN